MLSNMVETEEWQTALDNNALEDFYMDSSESEEFLEEQQSFFTDIVEESGLAP